LKIADRHAFIRRYNKAGLLISLEALIFRFDRVCTGRDGSKLNAPVSFVAVALDSPVSDW